MKYVSIFSVTLKSAITPSFIGLMATTFPGVRPSMSFASFPTATTSPVFLLMATMLGSFTTMPLPLENTSVFAVPKSMARSDENKLNTDRKLYPLFDIFPLRLRPHYPCPPPRPFRIMCCRIHKDCTTSLSQKLSTKNCPQMNQKNCAKFFSALRNHNLYRKILHAASAILSSNHDRVAAFGKRLSEIAEMSVRLNSRYVLSVDDERSARFRVADNFHHASMQHGFIYHQQHISAFALCNDGELISVARFAFFFPRSNRDHVPKIFARVQSSHFG